MGGGKRNIAEDTRQKKGTQRALEGKAGLLGSFPP